MSKIFGFLLPLTLFFLLITSPDKVLDSMTTGASNGVNLSLLLLGVYAVWLSVLEIMEKTKLNEKMAQLLEPFINKLFGPQDKSTRAQIAINLTSNLLGMGNASTPSGIEAMKKLDKKKGRLTLPMAMLMLLNTSAIQLIPTTIIGLRVAHNSQNPSSIILPTFIATMASTVVGIVLVRVFYKIFAKKSQDNGDE